jgi:cytoskeleton protein RodZ
MSQDEPNNSPAADTQPEAEPSVGERLRAARDEQPLSLAQIAAELRIEAHLLTALEEDRLEDFPAPVFAKGYLRQYGALLGLDERDLLAQYYRQVEIRDLPVIHQKPIRLRDEDQIRHWIAAAIVLLIIIVGVAIWWTRQPGIEPVIEDGVEPNLEQPEAVPSEAARPGLGATSVPIAVTERPVGPVPTPAPTAEPVAAAETEAAAADDLVAVELSFTEDCWTEISDARGERLFYGLGSAGARSRFNASLPISIFLGNAGGVELTVSGERYPIPAGSRQGNLARFVIADLDAG